MPPVAVADTATVAEDASLTSIDVITNDTDVDGDALTLTAVTTAGSGTVAINGVSVDYTPAANFNGEEVITYTVSDGTLTDEGTLTITVTPENDAPVAVADTATVAEDASLTSIDVITNDTDVDGDALTLTAVTTAGSGTVAINGVSVDYTPAANFNGEEVITYTVSDGTLTDEGTLTITVTPENDAPVAVADTATVAEDASLTSIDVITNDTDVDGDALTLTAVTTAGSGTVAINGVSVDYTPAANFNGEEVITYTVSDGTLTDEGTLTITVTPENDCPRVAVADTATVAEDASLTSIDVITNDTDVDGDALTLTAVTTAGSGTVAINGVSVDYTPAANFNGEEVITYTVSDGTLTDEGTLTITVTPENDAPVAVADTATVAEDASLTSIDVITNDTDVDGDALTLTAVTTAGSGTVAINGVSVDYTPAANFNGEEVITYTVSDGTLTDEGTLTITVTPENDAPVAVADTATVAEDASLTSIDVITNDTDVDGDALTLTAVTTAGSGTVAINGVSVDYTPAANFNGEEVITYTVSDGTLTDEGTLTITVTPENDAPVAVADTATVAEDASLTSIDVITNDTDVDGDALTLTAVTTAGSGTVAINGVSVDYTPAANFNGEEVITYTVSDGTLTDEGTLTITVTPENDAPVAVADTATVAEDASLTSIDVITNDTDVDGDALTLTAVTTAGSGTVAINGVSVDYTPAANFNGEEVITYTVSDGTLTDEGTLTITVTPENDAPVAVADTATVAEDASLTSIDVITNDTDVDGDALTLTAVTTAGSGTVAINGVSVDYTPAANFNGEEVITYTVSDGTLTDEGTLTITVTPENDAPVAVADTATVAEDASLTSIDVITNDTDVDGDALTLTAVTTAGSGTVAINGVSVDYTPAANFNGEEVITYTVSDGTLTDEGTLTITVTPENDAPVAVADTATVAEDASLTSIDVITNDTDVDGDALTLTAVTTAGSGTVAINGVSVDYTPAANFNGEEVITYTVSDGTLTDEGTLTITVTPENDAPVAVADTATVAEDASLTSIDVITNDTDVDGDALTLTAVTTAGSGTVAINGVSVDYTPAANFNGEEVITYTVSDGTLTDEGTLTITVTPENDAPVAVADTATVAEDASLTSIDVITNDTDVDGDALTLTAVTTAGSGTVAINGVSVDYTPAANFNGEEVITYTVSDGTLTDEGTLTITVTPENDAPVAVADTATVAEDASLTSIDVITNDTDVDGDALTLTAVTTAGSGTVAINGVSVDYTPAANFNGEEVITYTVSDGTLTDEGTLTITVTPENDAPVAVADTATVAEDASLTSIDVITNDTDVDGDALTLTAVTTAGSGTVAINGVSVDYTPAANFNGEEVITYTVSDGTLTDEGTLTITVTPENDAPVAVADTATVAEDASLTSIDVITNDTDVDGDALTLTAVTTAGSGTVAINGVSVDYTPAANFNGEEVITYTVSDGTLTDEGTLTITVTPENDAPVAVADTATVAEDASLTSIDVITNDTDVDGDALTLTAVTTAGSGTVAINGVSVDYTPAANFNGEEVITYTVSDGTLTDEGTLTITVTPENDAPVAVADTATVAEDASLTSIDVITNDTDVDGDALTLTAVTTAGSGTVAINGVSVDYTPAANFNGEEVITYTVSDGTLTDEGTLTITVTPENDAPVAVADTATVAEDASLTSIDVITNDTDVDGDALTLTAVTTAGSGTVAINGVSVDYTPAANFNGEEVITYTVSDGTLTDEGTLTITVTPENDAPVAVADTATVAEDASLTSIDVITNDTDVDGDALTLTAVTTAGSGTVAINGVSVDYTPAANFNGEEVITYTVSDGTLTDEGTLTITVTPENDAPVAVADTATVAEDASLTSIDVITNDTDVDGDALTLTAVTTAGSGTVAINGVSVDYTPAANFNGEEVITYTVSDGTLTDEGTLTITVTPENDAPVAVADTATVAEDASLTSIDVITNDTDVDGDALTLTAVTTAGSGTVAINGVSVDYTPAANFNGEEVITYTVSDGTLTDEGTLTITVTPENDAPVITSATEGIDIEENSGAGQIVYTITATDIDGDILTYAIDGDHSSLLSLDSSTGVVILTADPDYEIKSTYSFTVTASDGSNTSSATTVTFSITDVDDTIPEITLVGANPQSIELGTAYSELGATATDNIDGDITGSIVIDASAVDVNTVGDYTVTYDVQDAAGNQATQVTRTVTITADVTIPEITLVGANPQSIELGTAYSELGATATDNIDGDITGSIVIDASAVDVNTVGDYTVTYDVQDAAGNQATQVTRTVTIIDTTLPVLTVLGDNPATVEMGDSYTDAGATSDGGEEVTTTGTVTTTTVGEYTLTYTATDAVGNIGTATRTVNVVDTTAPIITVIGDNPSYIEKEAIYTDAGATSDGIEEVSSSVLVNTNIVGSYTVNYSATDASGNIGTATRTVIVEDTTAPVISGLDAYQVSENISNLNIATFTSELETVWSIAGVDATLFTINQEGELSFNTTPDFENPLDNDQNNTYTIEIFATDSYENTSELSIIVTVIDEDEIAPYVTSMTFNDNFLSGDEDVRINVKISENITGISEDSFVSNEGEFSSIAGSNKTFNIDFDPIQEFDGYAKIEIPAGSFVDASGNENLAYIDSVRVDTRGPDFVFEASRDTIVLNQTLIMTLSFTEEPNDFSAELFDINIGELTNLSKENDTLYSAIFTAPDVDIFGEYQEEVIISVAENTLEDQYGNSNLNARIVSFFLDTTTAYGEPEVAETSEGQPVVQAVFGSDLQAADNLLYQVASPLSVAIERDQNGNPILDENGNEIPLAGRDSSDPGDLVFNADGSFEFIPDEHFYGTVTFEHFITDEFGQEFGPYEVIIEIEEVPDEDGIPTALEEIFPSNDIDGDGIPDRKADHVVTFPMGSAEEFNDALEWANLPKSERNNDPRKPEPASMGSIVAGSRDENGNITADNTLKLKGISINPRPALDPFESEVNFNQDPIQFSLGSTENTFTDLDNDPSNGVQVRLVIDLPQPVKATTYLKTKSSGEVFQYLDDQNLATFDDGATLVDENEDGLIETVVITITDNGEGDNNPIAGEIDDPGALALFGPFVKNAELQVFSENVTRDDVLFDFFDFNSND